LLKQDLTNISYKCRDIVNDNSPAFSKKIS